MARECLPPGIWGISSWSCLELRNCGNAWWKAHPKNRPRTEISSPIPKDVTAQMHFWIFHIGHKFKLLTKQWAMRRESWRVVCNNISGEGEWDDSLRSTRVACSKSLDVIFFQCVVFSTTSIHILFMSLYITYLRIHPSAETHARHQYTTLLLTLKKSQQALRIYHVPYRNAGCAPSEWLFIPHDTVTRPPSNQAGGMGTSDAGTSHR